MFIHWHWQFLMQATMSATTATCFAQHCSPFWNGLPAPVGIHHRGQMAVFDDGSGPKLYATGYIRPTPPVTPGVARWDGRRWEVLSAGYLTHYQAGALHVLNDGNGERLYTGGYRDTPAGLQWLYMVWNAASASWESPNPTFADPGLWLHLSTIEDNEPVTYGQRRLFPTSAFEVLRWRGSGWEVIGTTNSAITGAVVHDDGTGARLHIMGSFTSINGIAAQRVAQWTGTSWEPLGSGIDSGSMHAMVSHNDGTGNALYVADVTWAAGGPINRIAKWDGHSWSDVGGGGIATTGIVTLHVLGSFDDGTGPALFAGGYMNQTGTGIPLRSIARFKNGVWDNMGGGVIGGIPWSMAVYDDGRGPSLFVGGEFHTVGAGAPQAARGVAQWVGCQDQCYADCDNSQVSPRLNVDDFTCFINKFAYGDPYVDCNQDGQRTIADFHCFLSRFSENCQ
jgi:hypothetical protein